MTDKETIRLLFESHYDRMYLLARILLHDDEESRDAVSDVFARIADGSIDVRPDTAGSFLLTCVRNKCLKMIRQRQVRQRAARLLPLDDTIEMMPLEAQTDRLTQFQLRFQQRKTYAEIAATLGISEAAVYKHLAQALQKIKSHFNP